MCQKLRPLRAYAAHRFFQLGVGVHRIAPVTFLPFIGAGEPCGPGLRGTVKENLVSTDPQTIFLLSPAEPGQERFSPLPGVAVGHNVQGKQVLTGEIGEHRHLPRAGKALLCSRNSAAEIILLCPFEIIGNFLRLSGGSRLRVESESRFLQIAVWVAVLAASDFSAVRIGRVPCNPHSVQRL